MEIDPTRITVMDGATGTELERRGVNITLPMWSARAVSEAPEVLEEIHREYLEAGASAITTCTFRTHRRSLDKAGRADEAEALTRTAVRCALRARDATSPSAVVMGGVAPLEDCYRPDRAPAPETCLEEHREIIGHMVDEGVDLVLIETMCSAHETHAAMTAAQDVAPGRWAVSFCLSGGETPGLLLDGTPVSALSDALDEAVFVGVNCTAPQDTAAHVAHLRKHVPSPTRLAAWANVGYARDDGSWVSTDAVHPDMYARHVHAWVEAGASVVGGCCGTTPATIAAIAEAV